ncbi:glutamine-hydrolyzing GMP synthase [Flavisolibacter ginsenosidimutans]|uniref:GMP synthase [glutamine-hydrolyzing] n=1 Tax=Flavisolibacter ginsenosidimutans TaxID=661481 RepID=A0A5B8UNC0_9BACT|nr:glutamine-hydrolyzing GMP synthase [Flavisolibacter ginsenosidimutans]QEC58063.1 glutamine-hydrolyzing GMP synthase [Flavisolibacter ginsenosidimutans]
MTEKIIILDFGSQYTQLIARAVREAHVYCEILPFSKEIKFDETVKGIILSGSPFSVNDANAPEVNVMNLTQHTPVLGVCYGAQLTAKQFGGKVERSNKREYGRAILHQQKEDALLKNLLPASQVWMSHGDSILELPQGFEVLATTDSIPVAAFKQSAIGNQQSANTANGQLPTANALYGLQFHPEVYHSIEGKKILRNFLVNICGCKQDWTPAHFITDTIEALQKRIGSEQVVMAISGGVDSTVAATLISRAIGENLHCIFVDNGVLRKDEYETVLATYKKLGLNVKGIDAKEDFYKKLKGKSDPEKKRKVIGKLFIDIFQKEAKKFKGVTLLGQGTIYPDVIESVSVHGPSVTIKSHHNVGGLPKKMHLSLVEPLRSLFKDEVRKVGLELGIPEELISRHPFPGPGLAIRILGEVTEEKVDLLQRADDIYVKALKEHKLYATVWQAGAILLPVKSVGVMGDERTYEFTVALRAVTSVDGMTADWAHLPYDFLARVSNEIINSVRGINRVVYDISSKPPATIEWE